MNEIAKKYLDYYILYLIEPFRECNKDPFEISISRIGSFIGRDNIDFDYLVSKLSTNDIKVSFYHSEETAKNIDVEYLNEKLSTSKKYTLQLSDLSSTIELASKTFISPISVLLMNIVARLICHYRIIYKAIILDLDDTLWPGTLSEDGATQIKRNLEEERSKPYRSFMTFLRCLAEELGIFIAICSRNEISQVEEVLKKLDDTIFPLKDQIDCVIANNNDKSENIKAICRELSILPSSVIFIDDNAINRSEVRDKVPGVFVPDWDNLDELETLLIVDRLFERFELSLNTQNKRKQFKIIKAERIKNALPKFFIEEHQDERHIQSQKLYAKSNQFKFIPKINPLDLEKHYSLYYELMRENGGKLGICSTLTFSISQSNIHVHNWAISCRYFEIGLEESILLQLIRIAKERIILLDFQKSEYNQKAQEFINKYKEHILYSEEEKVLKIVDLSGFAEVLQQHTNIQLK